MISDFLFLMKEAIKTVEEKVRRDFYEIESLQTSNDGAMSFAKHTYDFINSKLFKYFKEKLPEANLIFKDGIDNRLLDEKKKYNIYINAICGLNNFLHGIPYFCTVILLKKNNKDIKKEELICGVVNNYATQEMFFSEVGKGAFVDTRRMRVSSRANINTTVSAIKYDKDKSKIYSLLDKLPSVKINNCSILDMCNVACGKYDSAYIFDRMPVYAEIGELFVKEAGGFVHKFGVNDVLISNSLLHNNFKELLK